MITAVFRHPAVRDLALGASSCVAVALTQVFTAASPPLAAAAVIAVSAAAAMHARLAMGRWRAAALTIAAALVVALLGALPRLVGLVVATGLIGGELIARRTRRTMVLRVGVWLGLLGALVMLSGLFAVIAVPAGDTLREAAGAALGGFLSAQLLLAIGPLAEWALGHRTRLTLADWLNYEHPLLRQLAAAAPGTFQHSINVGMLADAGAMAIGADALLARVGGLYHDVGKIRAPLYFVENQHGENPHDRLPPLESAGILRAHVTEGVALVARHRMGEGIAEFVREHHGTGQMRIFRQKAIAGGAQPGDDDTRPTGGSA